jgi:predicted nucleic acid-binding protein
VPPCTIRRCENAFRYRTELRFTADLVDPAGVDVQVPNDRDDDLILATLLAAKADWLITGDTALLALRDRYPIIAPAEFATRHLG